MSCCNQGNNTFANLDNTWNDSSSLSMGKGNPYPELTNDSDYKRSWGSSENYEYNYRNNNGCSGKSAPDVDLSNYSMILNPNSASNMQMGFGKAKEGFECGDCQSTPYNTLGKTWSPQKKFSL
jgi:hypothetical protein